MKNRIIILLAVVMAIFAGSGCNKKIYLSTGLKSDELFKMSKEICKLPEALVILTAEKSSYENSYGEEIFNRQTDGTSLAAEVKKQIKAKLADIYGRKLLAIERGITLSTSEKETIDKASEAFYLTLTEEEISYLKINIENIRSLYSALYLGDKVYGSITDGIKYEVSDSEARVIKVQSIYISSKNAGSKNPEEIMSMIKGGSDFYSMAGKYTDDKQIEFEIGKGIMSPEYENAAFVLKKGEISDIVQTGDGCYIIKCIEDYIEDKTLENKNIILKNYKNKAFDEIYKPFLRGISSEFNDELWDGITFSFGGNVKADRLHSIYGEYMSVSKSAIP